MRKLRGFTLIELLIVVAIIAILAAIAVPNFLEAQIRSKVSRARSDMRSLATALESYYVDTNTYPALTLTLNQTPDNNLSASLTNLPGRTFRLRQSPNVLSTLTTPIAYITSYFSEPFSDTRGLTFRYYADRAGWILGSFGPDTDQLVGGDMDWNAGSVDFSDHDTTIETIYDSRVSNPSTLLLTGASSGTGKGSYTYDPTNGTVSQGDLWRVKE